MGNACRCFRPKIRRRTGADTVRYQLEFVDEEYTGTPEMRFGGEGEAAASVERTRSRVAAPYRYLGDSDMRVMLARNVFIDADEPFIDSAEDAEDENDEDYEMLQGAENAAGVLSRPPGDSLTAPVIEGEIYTGPGILKKTVRRSEIQKCVGWAPGVKPPARLLETDPLAEAYMAAKSTWVLQLSGDEKRMRRKLKKEAKLRQQATRGCGQTVQGIEYIDQQQPESPLQCDVRLPMTSSSNNRWRTKFCRN